MCTNKFRYPIIAIFCFDENDKAQLLAVGIISGKTFNDFMIFLKDISELINIRVFICDRLEAQYKAIKKVFNTSHIVFCRLHIKRNIIDHCGKNSKIYSAINDLFNKRISSQEYLKILNEEINSKPKYLNHLLLLREHFKHYDPEVLKNLRLRDHYTSNMLEGIFSTIKTWSDHKILPLAEVLNIFIMHSDMLIKKIFQQKELLLIQIYIKELL